MRVKDARQTFLGFWLRLILDGRGDRRSSATARSCATSPTSTTPSTRSCSPARATRPIGQVFNLGGDEAVSLRELAELLVDVERRRLATGSCRFPPERKAIDIGDYYGDYRKIERGARLGAARRRSRKASSRSLAFYRAHAADYWDASMTVPFLDLSRRCGRVRRDASTRPSQRVLDSGWFLLGPEVEAFEAEFAAYCGARMRSASPPAPTRSDRAARRSASSPATRSSRAGEHRRPDRRRDRGRPARCPCSPTSTPRTRTLDPAVARARDRGRTRAVVAGAPLRPPADMDADRRRRSATAG